MVRTYPTVCPTSFTRLGAAVVRRIDLDLTGGTVIVEISVLRTHTQRCPTYQGEIQLVAGGWKATGISHRKAGESFVDLGTFADFADAQARLVRHRSGHLSRVTWTGPRPGRRPRLA